MLKSHRICPDCGGYFTVDAATKRRQAGFIVVALVLLAFTLLLYFRGVVWLLPVLVMSLVLIGLVAWANRRVYLVPAEDRRTRSRQSRDR